MRGSWRPNITATFWSPLLWQSTLCLSRSPGLLAQRPTLLGDGFLYCILSATSVDPNSSGAPRAPSAWCGFPYHISSLPPSPTVTPTQSEAPRAPSALPGFPYHILSAAPTVIPLSWLSYIIVQRPLNRLLNLWNGMFDRHQAEITVMQFTGHSLPVHHSVVAQWDIHLVPYYQP